MTYTIAAHCPRTGQLGIGIATFSLAVGGYCPLVKSHVGAVSSQAHADPRLRRTAVRLLELGYSPAGILAELRANDPDFEYRQIGIVDKDGRVAAHTGAHTRPWTGHAVGEGYAVFGNHLDGEHVLEAMSEAFERTDGGDLDDRLLTSLEAGRDVGGQLAAFPDWPNQDRSAALIVYEDEDYAVMDLRVDSHETGIAELRRLWAEYRPYIPWYYQLRVKDPEKAPSHQEFFEQQRALSRKSPLPTAGEG